MFVDRQRELAFFNTLLARKRPGPAQMVLLYGRRRVGKTTLLQHWMKQSGLPGIYWVANKEAALLQRRSLFARVMEMPEEQATPFDSWPALWEWLAPRLATQQKQILVLDELPYAVENDTAMLSSLQHAWDQHLKESQVILVLCGSHVNTMESIMHHQSPLFGRPTGQWHLKPLPFSALSEFFPGWSAEERVAVYAIVGGVPAYLEWLDPELSLVENIREVILSSGSMFMAEPRLLLYDEVREPDTYLSVLQAIAKGYHAQGEIANACLIGSDSLSYYLSRLQELHMVERRLPATLTVAQRRRSKSGRYHLSDPYFRFYFRFLAPHQQSLLRPEETLIHIQTELRAFVASAFEQLAQQWVATRPEGLPFVPETIGSHWSRRLQIDVVAVNWQSKDILLGECKWGEATVSRNVVRELIEEKGPRLLTKIGDGWNIHYAFFARRGFTDAALHAGHDSNAIFVDLDRLDADLRTAAAPEAQ
jgi:AAA+ ATPase superfamily predicted ATPase